MKEKKLLDNILTRIIIEESPTRKLEMSEDLITILKLKYNNQYKKTEYHQKLKKHWTTYLKKINQE